MEDVTVARIIELQCEGLNAAEIAERLGCHRDTIYHRLRKMRRSSPEAAREDAARRVCECGKAKQASKGRCTDCSRGRKKGD